jgi:hypothetical protein
MLRSAQDDSSLVIRTAPDDSTMVIQFFELGAMQEL